MARVKFYLDKRPTSDGRSHIKLLLSHGGTVAMFSTGVFVRPEYWHGGDAEIEPHIKKSCPGARVMNITLSEKIESVQAHLRQLTGKLHKFNSATQIKNHIQDTLDGKTDERGLIGNCFRAFIDRSAGGKSKSLYEETLNKIAKHHDVNTLSIEDVTVSWLKNFESQLRMDGLKVNTIARHMREIRAVWNDAIDSGVTQLNDYPFRRFKIRHEKTAKRSLTVEQLRELRDYPCEPYQEKYRDVFMLMFYLGGINLIDLFGLTTIDDGRIDYRRSKTGVHVNIAVPPEAMAIIDRYRGREHLLSMADRYKNHEDFLHRMDRELKRIGPSEMVLNNAHDPHRRKRNKRLITPLFPTLSSYWARHTVATLMAEIDIPDTTIDRVLAHADNSITAIYIRRNQQKVDDAIRRVIDFVNG